MSRHQQTKSTSHVSQSLIHISGVCVVLKL